MANLLTRSVLTVPGLDTIVYAIKDPAGSPVEGKMALSELATLYATAAQGVLASTALQDAPNNGSQYARQNGAWAVVTGGVASVFGRTGAVVAVSGDYSAALIANTPAGGIAAVTVQAAIDELDTEKQPLDATLTALAAYNTNGLLTQTAADTFTGRSIAVGAGGFLSVADGNGVAGNPTLQLADAELLALAGLTSAADKLPYFTGLGTAALTDLTAFARTILDDANQGAAQTTLGLVIGTNVQAWDADLDTLAGLSKADSNFIVGDGAAWVVESGATVRTSLGLGTIATQNANNVTISGGSVTGITDLAIADGGTGQGTAQLAINALSSVAGATNEHVLTKDTATGNAIFKAAAGGSTPTLAQVIAASLTTANLTGVLAANQRLIIKATDNDPVLQLDEATQHVAVGPNAVIDASVFSGEDPTQIGFIYSEEIAALNPGNNYAYGITSEIKLTQPLDYDNTYGVYGMVSDLRNYSGLQYYMVGIYGSAKNESSDRVDYLSGLIYSAENEENGTVGEAKGASLSVVNTQAGTIEVALGATFSVASLSTGYINQATIVNISRFGNIDNIIGLNIEDITGTSSAFAIKTGVGLVQFGDDVKIVGDVGFYNTAPVAKPTVSGSRAGNAALASLLTALASQGLITNSTSA